MTPGEVVRILQDLSGRWTIPILLSLRETGGRFTPLQRRLDISPSRLSGNLKKLEEKGLLRHLSPYERRHPLLPEYELTEKGRFMQEAARLVQQSELELGHGFLSEKLWNWPVLVAVHHQYVRFQAIRSLLETATPRAMTMRIEELSRIGLIHRILTSEPRPGHNYLLEPSAEPPIERMEAGLSLLL